MIKMMALIKQKWREIKRKKLNLRDNKKMKKT